MDFHTDISYSFSIRFSTFQCFQIFKASPVDDLSWGKRQTLYRCCATLLTHSNYVAKRLVTQNLKQSASYQLAASVRDSPAVSHSNLNDDAGICAVNDDGQEHICFCIKLLSLYIKIIVLFRLLFRMRWFLQFLRYLTSQIHKVRTVAKM